jgi:hypothetical protein
VAGLNSEPQNIEYSLFDIRSFSSHFFDQTGRCGIRRQG